MSQLLYSASPVFTDVADSDVATDDPLLADSAIAISQNAKFGAARLETIFMGYYKHADVVPVPISPIDGYVYSRAETSYVYQLYSTRAPAAGFEAGKAWAPEISASQVSNLYYYIADLSNSTGVVSLTTAYIKKTTETPTNDGVIKVYAHCQRAMSALGAQPTFLNVADDVFAIQQPLRQAHSQAVNRNAKFGAVRKEIFFAGYATGGYTVPLPTSPIDGYTYAREELQYRFIPWSTLAPAGAFTNGTTTVPSLGAGTLAKRVDQGPLYYWSFDINEETGVTVGRIGYYKEGGAATDHTGDGIFKIYIIAQRSSVAGVSGSGAGSGGEGGVGGSGPGGSINTSTPQPPIVGVVRTLALSRSARYTFTVGIDEPTDPSNWNFLSYSQIQIANDSGFATLDDGPIFDRVYAQVPPFTIEFETNYPGTYFFRGRVLNGFGWSGWGPDPLGYMSVTTDLLDALAEDTTIMNAPTHELITNAAGDHPELGGNEFQVNIEIPEPDSATYWGYQIFAHNSSTLPTATKFDTGIGGVIEAGVPALSDASKGWTPGGLVGKDIVAFGPSRSGAITPTFDYEGMIIYSQITANTATQVTFKALKQNLRRNLTGLKYYIVDHGVGHHFFQKLKYVSPVIVDEGVTGGNTLDQSGRGRNFRFVAGFTPVHVWISLQNVFGMGKVTASPPNATFAGITTSEMKLAAVTTVILADNAVTTQKIINDAITGIKVAINAITTTKISDDAVTTPKLVAASVTTGKIDALAVTADKISVSQLSAINANCGTITSGTITGTTIQTSAVGSGLARVEITASDGLRGYNSSGTLRVQIPVSGSYAGNITAHELWGVDTTVVVKESSGTSVLSLNHLAGFNFSQGGSSKLSVGGSSILAGSGVVFNGDGSGLTGLNGSNVSSGTVADARIASTIARKSMGAENINFSSGYGVAAGGVAVALGGTNVEAYTSSTLRATFGSETSISIGGTRYTLTVDGSGFVKAF